MEYHERIQRVIDYIEARIYDDISIEETARQAFMSVPHLYRIFPYIAGCTVGTYIRKRRLTLSAQALRDTDQRIIDIAVNYGFESQESYIRSFKQMFGVTPGEYRKTKNFITLYSKLQLPKRREIVMQPEVIIRK